jgi:hypothetical protein
VSSLSEHQGRQSKIINGYFPEAGVKEVCTYFLRVEEVCVDNANLAIWCFQYEVIRIFVLNFR